MLGAREILEALAATDQDVPVRVRIELAGLGIRVPGEVLAVEAEALEFPVMELPTLVVRADDAGWVDRSVATRAAELAEENEGLDRGGW